MCLNSITITYYKEVFLRSIIVYIPKANHLFAQQLAEKKYLSKKLEELIHEKRAIDFYLRHHSDNTSEQ